MYILHVIHTVNPAAGGPIEAVRTLFTYSDLGYRGEIVTLDPPNAPYLETVPVPVHALGPAIGGYGFSVKLVRWIFSNGHRFDGVVVNGLWQFCGLAVLLSLPRSIPYMVFTHGMLDPYFKNAYPLKHLKKLLYWTLGEYWVLRNAHRVLFTTETEATLAQESFHFWNWTKEVVPYGIRPPSISRAEAREAFLSKASHLEGKRFLLFLGRIHPKKGCDLLLHAFARFTREDSSMHLIMAGPVDPSYAKELDAIIQEGNLEDRVFWLGPTYGLVKWGALAEADAFILPSHQENFGIAVAEALAMNTPVLLSDKVNIVDVIRDDGCFLVAQDTVEGTYDLIRRWSDLEADMRLRMRFRAGQSFGKRFDMSVTANIILELFTNANPRGVSHAK